MSLQLVLSCWGDEAEPTQVWSHLLGEDGLSDIARRLANSDPVPWPQAKSWETIRALPSPQREAGMSGFHLAEALLDKIRDFEADTSNDDLAELSRRVQVYRELGQGLVRSGGPVNAVLLDVVDRMALTRLCHFLVHHPDQYGEVEQLLEMLAIPVHDWTFFAPLLQEGTGEPPSDDLVDEASEGDFIERIIAVEKEKLAAHGWVPDATEPWRKVPLIAMAPGSHALMYQNTVAPLALHMEITSRLANCGLRGLIEYLRRGGALEDFPVERSAFEAVMGSALDGLECQSMKDKTHMQVHEFIYMYVIQCYRSGLKDDPLRHLSLSRWSPERYQAFSESFRAATGHRQQ
jgi:hypothetical protein